MMQFSLDFTLLVIFFNTPVIVFVTLGLYVCKCACVCIQIFGHFNSCCSLIIAIIMFY